MVVNLESISRRHGIPCIKRLEWLDAGCDYTIFEELETRYGQYAGSMKAIEKFPEYP